MQRFLAIVLLAIFCFSIAPIQPVAAGPSTPIYLPIVFRDTALNVWTASPAAKIQPTTAPGGEHAISLEGARGAYEAYQIVVTANAALSGVNMSASDLSDGLGHKLLAANLTFFREAFIDFTGVSESEPGNLPVPQNSPTHDARIPDPLIPFIDPYTPGRAVGAPFNVAAGLNQPVWLDVLIPANTVAGSYTGVVTVTASQQQPVAIPITLTVWNLTLPDMNVVTTYFGMHTNAIIDYHSGTRACSGSNCWLDENPRSRAIVKRYEELLHQHRTSTWPNFIPDPGNGCNPPSPSEWASYDAAMQPYMDGTYWSNGVPSSWIPTPFSPGVTWGLEANCDQTHYTGMAKAWADHLKDKGWFDKALVYAADEPDSSLYPDIKKNSTWMQNGDKDWKAHIMDTTTPAPSNVSTLNPALGIYTVALAWYDNWYHYSPANEIPYGRSNWPTLFQQHIQLWFYESNAQSAPYPTFAANTLLGYEPRIMLWGAWYEQASGFLLWDTTAWTSNKPWGPNVGYGKSGDGVLVYPGNHDGLLAPVGSPGDVAIDGPIPSYRLKMVRLGLQDWALFKLAESKGLGATARAQVQSVYGQLGGCEWQGCPPKVNGQFFWKTDEALMRQARHNIAQAIMETP